MSSQDYEDVTIGYSVWGCGMMGMAVGQFLLFSFRRGGGCVAVVLAGPMAPSLAACGVNIKLIDFTTGGALSSISLSIERAPSLRNSCMPISFALENHLHFFSSLFLSLYAIYFIFCN